VCESGEVGAGVVCGQASEASGRMTKEDSDGERCE
jgi:hypothetical protein